MESRSGGEANVTPEAPFALSVDVEDYFQVQAFARYAPRDEWSRFPSRVHRNTQRLLDLFDETGSTATFFTLGWIAEAHPSLVREIAARGHEIASHGMDHRMLTELDPVEFRAQARDSRALLQDLSQQPVIGYRAPSYSVGRTTLWAIEALAACGYEYDSSVYPIRRRRYGYAEGPVDPARMAGETGATLPEFPLPTIGFGPIRVPVLAGAYLRLWPAWVSRYALERHRAEGRAVIVNVHPWEVDPDQPTVGPSRRATWTHYARLARTEGILRSLLVRDRYRDAATRLRQIGLLPSHEAGARA